MPQSQTTRRLLPLLPTAAAAASFFGASAEAAIFDSFDTTRHARFSSGPVTSSGNVTNPTFLLADFDLSGIGVGSAGGVLISDRHVLAANHNSNVGTTFSFVNAAGDRVSVSASVENTLATTYTVGGVATTGVSDLAVYTLSTPIDTALGLTPLPIVTGSIDDFTNATLFAFDQDSFAGRNLIDGGVSPNSGIPIPPVLTIVLPVNDEDFPTYAVAYDFDTAANGGLNGLGGDEIGLTGGDSGHAAVTLDRFGNIAVVGAHSAILQGDDHIEGDNYISFTALAAAYADQIAVIVANDGGVVTFSTIPEPTTAVLLLPAALLLRRRL